ncbi:MAG: hypothetical protein C4K60_00700 [Ideonella sp. MAG2]|nr:MAG: hypothetical protein C4K60_00700 [Ideonella sp. MAG2]
MNNAATAVVNLSTASDMGTELPDDFKPWRHGEGCLTEPLPSRLLLWHRAQSLQEGRQTARNTAGAYMLLAVWPAALVFVVLHKIGLPPAFALGGLALSLLHLAARAYLKARATTDGQPWDVHEWIDFERCMWCSRRTEPEGREPIQMIQHPLHRLALVCYVHTWEQRNSYEVCLSELTEMGKTTGLIGPPRLSWLMSFDTEAESFIVAQGLAKRWGITCWHRRSDADSELRQLCDESATLFVRPPSDPSLAAPQTCG